MSDVGKRTSMNDGSRILCSLHKVGSESVAQQYGDGTSHAEVFHSERLSVDSISQEDILDASAQVVLVFSKAEYGHNLRCRSDVEARLAHNAVGLAAHTRNDVAQTAVVYVEHTVPQHLAQGEPIVAVLIHIVIQESRDGVVCRCDGVEVASEVEVYLVHREHLSVSAATSSAFQSEYRSK